MTTPATTPVSGEALTPKGPMKPLPEAEMAPAISSCMAMVAEAKAALLSTVQRVQSACEHRVVSEAPYRSPNMNAERICMHCRLIETGSHWSGGTTWSRQDFKPPTLGNDAGRLVLNVSRDDLWALRAGIPTTEPDHARG